MTTADRLVRYVFRAATGEYGHGAKAIERSGKKSDCEPDECCAKWRVAFSDSAGQTALRGLIVLSCRRSKRFTLAVDLACCRDPLFQFGLDGRL